MIIWQYSYFVKVDLKYFFIYQVPNMKPRFRNETIQQLNKITAYYMTIQH